MASSWWTQLVLILQTAYYVHGGPGTSSTTCTKGALEEVYGWDYDHQSDWPCIASTCSDTYQPQSPVDVDTSYLYEAHGIDELKFIVGNEGYGCSKAKVEIYNHTWKVKFKSGSGSSDSTGYANSLLDCDDAYVLKFKGGRFKAKYFEFHFPAEHSVDHEHADMEIQFAMDDGEGTTIMIAVMVDVNETYTDNPFLAPIWDKAQSYPNTYKTYKRNQLNFVDQFLPSQGLRYEYYYYYYGTKTSPPCEGHVKWVIMKYPVQMSQTQYDTFRNSVLSNPTTTASNGSYGTRRYPQFSLGQERHVYDFPDDYCYVRACHKIFETGVYLIWDKAIYCLAGLLVFTIAFEYVTEVIEHETHGMRTAHRMVDKIYKELTILGVVSFIAFVMLASCKIKIGYEHTIDDDFFVAFEYMHLLIFGVAILYVTFNSLAFLMMNKLMAGLDKVLFMKQDQLGEFIEKRYSNRVASFAMYLAGFTATSDYATVHLKSIFLEMYNLPSDFDFTKYIKYYLSEIVCESLELTESVWLTCFLYVTAIFAIVEVKAETADYFALAGWVAFATNLAGLYCANMSFSNLMNHYGIFTHDDAFKMATIRKRSYQTRAVNSSAPSVAAVNEATDVKVVEENKPDNAGAELKPPPEFKKAASSDLGRRLKENMKSVLGKRDSFLRKFARKDSKAGDLRAKLAKAKEAEKEKHDVEHVIRPFGSIMVIQFIAEASSMLSCFYCGLWVLTYSQLMDLSGNILTAIPVMITVLYLNPKLHVQMTIVKAFVYPETKLIGEVTEYMKGIEEMRSKMVDVLFPELKDHLMDPISITDIVQVFDHFDKDGSFTIEPNEFIKGCQKLQMHLSQHNARRLLRLLDEDKSGEIDTSEVFKILALEKEIRVSKLAKELFVYITKDEHAARDDQIYVKDLDRLTNMMCGHSLPTEAMIKSARSFLVTEPGQETIGWVKFIAWCHHWLGKQNRIGEGALEMMRQTRLKDLERKRLQEPRKSIFRKSDRRLVDDLGVPVSQMTPRTKAAYEQYNLFGRGFMNEPDANGKEAENGDDLGNMSTGGNTVPDTEDSRPSPAVSEGANAAIAAAMSGAEDSAAAAEN